jgi:hypothetical protein
VLERLHSCCPTSTHLDWGMVQRDERRHGEQCHAHDAHEALSGSFVVPGAAPEPKLSSKRSAPNVAVYACAQRTDSATTTRNTATRSARAFHTLTGSSHYFEQGGEPRISAHATRPLPQLNTSTQRSHTNATPSTQSCTVTGLKPIPMLKALRLISCPSSSSSPSPPRTRYRVPAPEPTCRAALLLVRALPQQPWATQAVGAYQGSASL